MAFKTYRGLLSIGAAALMLTATTASAQDTENCIADFALPVPAEGLCLDEEASSGSTEEDADAFDRLLLESARTATEECADNEDYDACTSCVVAAETELSAGCSYCYMKHVECIQTNCTDACGVDIDLSDENEACGQCIEAQCVDATGLCANGEEADDNDEGAAESDNDDKNDENGEVDDPYGQTCTNGPDCKDGEWDVAQTGGRVGSSCAMTDGGAGGGIAAILLGLGLVAQRRRRN